jgi:spore germination protein GerM
LRRLVLAILLGAALALLIGWLWFGRYAGRTTPGGGASGATGAGSAAGAGAPGEETRRIRATLFYVAEDGNRLVGVDREVVYAEGPVDQARRLMEALVAPLDKTPSDKPLLQAIPADTKLRTLFITDTGDAFVDFSPELASKHPGGSLSELLTVYAIVDTLTVNLPAIVRVQILVDGKEVDTLAGHVDLRRPLVKNLTWTRPPDEAPAPTDPATAPPAAGARPQ